MSVINKQVKHVMSNYPYYLSDCRIVEMVEFTLATQEFEIYRIECLVRGKLRYLDLITDTNHWFLGMGAYNRANNHGFDVSNNICQSLAVQKYLELKAF